MYAVPNSVSDVATPFLFINVILPFCGIWVSGKGRENLPTDNEPYILAGNHVSLDLLLPQHKYCIQDHSSRQFDQLLIAYDCALLDEQL